MSDRLHFSQGLPLVENLDSLPIASYDHYPVADLGLDLLRIEAGRGCPFACTFCSTAGFFQRKFRLKSADRLVIELDLLNQQYGYSDFKLDHDLFTVNRHKVMEFCEAVKDRGYRWRASARVDCVNEELLTKMAEAGCVGLYFGIETGSKRMQQISRKRLHLDLVLPTLDIAEHLGIDTTASFITGYPEELERDQDETLDLIGHCHRPSCLSQLHILTPEPGTPMYEKYGDQLAYDGHSGPYNAFPLSEEDECLLFEQKDIFQTYHYYPSQIPRHQHLFAVNAVDMLRRVGPIILRYALRAYDGRLSGLVRDLQRYIEDYYPKRPLASHIIESYLVSKFGPRHHLVSLFRYAHIQHHAQQASEGCEAGTMPNRFDPNLAYQLGPSVHILHDLHDCGALIERITHQSRNDDLLDEGEVGERGIYLLNTVGGNSMHCCIEEEVEAILELFRSPLSFAAIAESIGETGEDGPFKDFFEQLVQSGVLVPYGAGASGVGQPRRVFGFESTCV